jgi:uncharacterized protein YfiM (DUF2279 family)
MKIKHKIWVKYLVLIGVLFSFLNQGFSQPDYKSSTYESSDSVKLNKKKLNKLLIISGVTYTSGLIGLNELWYKQHPRQQFHFFNDNPEWMQVDKLGHFYSSYQLARVGAIAISSVGIEKRKAHLYGSLLGTIALTPIEVLDGFSAGYGASWGDVLANFGGTVLYGGQYALWGEERIYPKFSFSRTLYAQQRPNLLGSNLIEELLKDYNGQSYWISIDLDKFAGERNIIPKWINLGIGYRASGMIYGREYQNIEAGFHPYRRYFLGIDFDFTYLKSRKKWVNTLLAISKGIRIPAPAFELNRETGFKVHPMYF